MIEWWKIDYTKNDINAIVESIKQKKVSQGKNNSKLELKISKLLNVKYCVTSTSGTTAIMLALKALGVKRNDEVILPNRNWIASANVLKYLGVKIKLVDIKGDGQIIDEEQIEKNINKKTKLIFPAHLNGKSSNMRKILALAKKYKIKVLEDAAQGLMATYDGKYLGTIGDVGIFSMAMTKILSTGQGGLVVTNNKKIYKRLLELKNHGLKNPFELDWNIKDGLNFKFTDLQASLANSQISILKKRKKKLIENYLIYKKGLEKIDFIEIVPYDLSKGELPLWIECKCKKRDKVIKILNKNKIQARPVYPSLNKFERFGNQRKKFANSDFVERNFLYLPSGVNIKKTNIYKVLKVLYKISNVI